MLLAKESIMAPVDIHELKAKAASGAKLTRPEELRLELTKRSTRSASARRASAA
jgi:fumarate hydratase class I